MSRSGYRYDDDQTIPKRFGVGGSSSATRSKRGQKLLRDLAAALDAMPEQRLITEEGTIRPAFPTALPRRRCAVAKITVLSNPDIAGASAEWLLDYLGRMRDEMREFPIPKEIVEVAAEIVSGSDVIGIEHSRLLDLLSTVLFLDRMDRPPTKPEHGSQDSLKP